MQSISFYNPLGLSFTLSMGFLMLVLPRKYALIPLIATACYITLGQRIVFLTLDFTMLRILILFGFVRLFIRNEIFEIELNAIDKALIYWSIAFILTYTISHGTLGALINRLGRAYDALGVYFLSRFLIKDCDDFSIIFKSVALIIIPLALLMLIESQTGKNFFSVFRGVPLLSQIREGHIRCQGSFRHPILVGTFGATLVPLFIALWWHEGHGKLYSVLGITCASIIVITTRSSGPQIAYILGIAAIMVWCIRTHMRALRWTAILTLVGLHMYMKAPVWFAIAHIAKITGGTGWHRAQLIDQAIQHFNEWWLIGTTYTAHWDIATVLEVNPNMIDITNQFVGEGVNGGLITLGLFVLIIVRCFRSIGNSIQANPEEPFALKFTLWSMGAALFTHNVSFISVSYFDQITVFWYLLLALIATLNVDAYNTNRHKITPHVRLTVLV
jgi:hypothetical protein